MNKKQLCVIGISCVIMLSFYQRLHAEEFVGMNPNQLISPPLEAAFLPGHQDRILVLTEDKSIRIVDTATRSVIDSFRFEAGKGRRGELSTFTVSPNGELFAVGTFGEPGYWAPRIYVVSLRDRKITNVLKDAHKRTVTDLKFCANSNELVSISRDGKVAFWSLQDNRTTKQFSVAKTNPVNGDERFPTQVKLSPDGKSVACATNFGDVFLFDAINKKQLWAAKPHRQRVAGLAWINSKIITASHDGKIKVLDSTEKGREVFAKSFGPETNFASLAVRPKTSEVFWASGDWDNLAEWYKTGGMTQLGVLDINNGQSKIIKKDKLHSAIQFSDDGSQMITCAGPRGNSLSLYATQSMREITSLTSELGRVFQPRFVGNNGQTIAWGENYNHLSSKIPQTKEFDTVRLQRSQRRSTIIASPRFDQFGNHRFSQPAPTPENPNTSNLWVLLEQPETAGKQPARSGKLDRKKMGERIYQAAMLSSQKVYVSTDRGQFLFNPFAPDNPLELTGQIGRVSVNVQRDDKRKLFLTNTGISVALWDSDTTGDPLVNYIFAENDYVAWTPDGYYACSAGGERLVGWHVNNGEDEFASFFPLEKFSDKYFNEELIRSIAKDKLAKKKAKPAEPIAAKIPAMIEIVEPIETVIDTDTNEILVKVKANSKRGRGKVSEVSLLINNRVRTEYFLTPKSGENEFEFPVRLAPGEQAIRARVYSSDTGTTSESNQTIRVTYTPPNAQRKPIRKLYFLGVGIDEYEHFNDLNYCVSDVQRIAKIMKSDRSSSLFLEKPEIKVLENPESKADFEDAVDEISESFGATDLLVVYWSGHGANDDNRDFHFVLPPCEDPEVALNDRVLRRKGLSADELAEELTRLEGHIIVLLGTCFSGKAVNRIEEAVERLGRESSRTGKGLMMISSAGASQEAFEDRELKSSRFAFQLQKALLGEETVGVTEMPYYCETIDGECIVFTESMKNYLIESMKHITNGTQEPVQSGFDFRSFKLTKVRPDSGAKTGGQK